MLNSTFGSLKGKASLGLFFSLWVTRWPSLQKHYRCQSKSALDAFSRIARLWAHIQVPWKSGSLPLQQRKQPRFPVMYKSSLIFSTLLLKRNNRLDVLLFAVQNRGAFVGLWHRSVYHTVNVIKSKSCQCLLARGWGGCVCSSNSPPSVWLDCGPRQ